MISIEAIKAFSDRLVEVYHPHRVVLFGSHAENRAGEDSDVDMLVVVEHEGRASRLAGEMVARLKPPFPVDLLVRAPGTLKNRIALGDPFLLEILKHGKVLHEAS